MLHFVVGKKVAEERQLGESGPSVDGVRVGALDQPAEDVDLAILQTDIMLDAALTDDRLVDSADVLRSGHRGNHHVHLHADLMIRMDARRHIHIYAHIEVLKLYIYHRIKSAGRTRPHP